MKPKIASLNSPVVEAMPTGSEVREARAYLHGATFNRNGTEIQPRRFAAAAKETGSSFGDLLKVIARSYGEGQNQEAQRQQDISDAAKSGA